MTRSTILLKISIDLLLLALFVGPIIYGLSQYNWNLKNIPQPIYTPPNINFRNNFKSYSFEGNRFIVVLEVENTGDIDVVFKNLSANLRDSSNVSVANVYMEKAVKIIHNTYEDILLYIPLDNQTIKKLVESYLKTENTTFKLVGNFEVIVFSSTIYFPVEMNLQIPYPNNITTYISSTEKIGNKLIIHDIIENPTLLTLILENASLTLYTSDYQYLSEIRLETPVNIEAGTSSNITLSLELTPELMQLLHNYYGDKEEFKMRICGELHLKYEGYSFVKEVDIPITLNRSILG